MTFKQTFPLLILLGLASFAYTQQPGSSAGLINEVEQTLDRWHRAAAEADFDAYFGLMTEDSHFLGTDASENWSFEEFKVFSKPYFQRGRAWSFSRVDRNIFGEPEGEFAYFDELLNTQMGLCRGSGVLQKVNGEWKIQHYVLSIAVPNEDVDAVVARKKSHDSLLIRGLLEADRNR